MSKMRFSNEQKNLITWGVLALAVIMVIGLGVGIIFASRQRTPVLAIMLGVIVIALAIYFTSRQSQPQPLLRQVASDGPVHYPSGHPPTNLSADASESSNDGETEASVMPFEKGEVIAQTKLYWLSLWSSVMVIVLVWTLFLAVLTYGEAIPIAGVLIIMAAIILLIIPYSRRSLAKFKTAIKWWRSWWLVVLLSLLALGLVVAAFAVIAYVQRWDLSWLVALLQNLQDIAADLLRAVFSSQSSVMAVLCGVAVIKLVLALIERRRDLVKAIAREDGGHDLIITLGLFRKREVEVKMERLLSAEVIKPLIGKRAPWRTIKLNDADAEDEDYRVIRWVPTSFMSEINMKIE